MLATLRLSLSRELRRLDVFLWKTAMSLQGGADLPEADASDMNHFIKEFLTILPVLGVEVFRGRSSKWDDALKAGEELQYDSPIFQVSVKKHGGTAYGQIIDGEFTVLKGSAIAAEVTRKDNVVESTRRQFELRKQLHERLNNEGAIVIDDKGIATLTRDVPFSSPSAAAAFVQGRATANGRREWRTKDNDTYADWEGRK
ncbi:methionine sulfoxide reductase A [Bifidobacterium adolescentis]|uniref:Methionine sulfoxide reductase A n=1 Tax=Bifidobacterium adolescentis TaxID=1680 RepID=A0A173W4Q9_BIFAD|nr:methionine sulfoxide reductase A [Bifidobacterium adolescentis]